MYLYLKTYFFLYKQDSDFSTVHFDNVLLDLILPDVKKDVLPNEGMMR